MPIILNIILCQHNLPTPTPAGIIKSKKVTIYYGLEAEIMNRIQFLALFSCCLFIATIKHCFAVCGSGSPQNHTEHAQEATANNKSPLSVITK